MKGGIFFSLRESGGGGEGAGERNPEQRGRGEAPGRRERGRAGGEGGGAAPAARCGAARRGGGGGREEGARCGRPGRAGGSRERMLPGPRAAAKRPLSGRGLR